jgi:trans-4-hydroxy-L-proline dehydratase
LYPYYEKDLREGNLSHQDMAEMLGCLWIKFNELQSFHGLMFSKEAAGSLLQQITIGGTDKDSRDATNALSYFILEISRQMKVPQSGIYVRWHPQIDHNFMLKAVETNRDTGAGIPAFLNDQAAIRNFLGWGIEYEDAIEWSAAGCLSYGLGNVNTVARMPLYFNVPKILEITLNNGIDPRTGIKAGKETGDATKFNSLAELEKAFYDQYDYFINKGLHDYYIGFLAKGERLCAPWSTALLEDSIKKGKDSTEEGGRYPQLNVVIGQRGYVDVANALAAIQKVVFDDRKVTLETLLAALKANWEGYEDTLQLCMQAPKYGNDDDYVDEIFNRAALTLNEMVITKQDPSTGARWKVSRPALTGHYYLGEVVGALPNGRKAGTPLYDACLSPGAGTDVNGPTSVIRSATKVNNFKPYMDSMVLNMKLSPSVLKDREALENFISLLRTFFNRGGWHIQFNILNREDLIAAKQHPEEWKHLIVRVVGYSAYFVELPEAIQDEIIARTEHGL